MVSLDQSQILLASLWEKTLRKSYSLLADIISGHAMDFKSNQTFISCDKANSRITYIVGDAPSDFLTRFSFDSNQP